MQKLIALILLLVLLFHPVSLFAQDQLASPSGSAKEEYHLPYPGLLPDNPLYPFKIFRDRLVYFLISDPVKKAEFAILQADKGLSSGLYLLQRKNKDEALAFATIAKGEKYFPNALKSVIEAKKQGVDVDLVSQKLVNSTEEHRIILLEIEKITASKFTGQVNELKKDVESYHKEAIKLAPTT